MLHAVACNSKVGGACSNLSSTPFLCCAAGGQWIPDLIHLAGARDVAQQPGDRAKHIEWDTIRKYAPDVLLICPCSSNLERSLGEMCLLAKLPGWWALPAVKAGQVYICEHVYFSRPGPRYVACLVELYADNVTSDHHVTHDMSWYSHISRARCFSKWLSKHI